MIPKTRTCACYCHKALASWNPTDRSCQGCVLMHMTDDYLRSTWVRAQDYVAAIEDEMRGRGIIS